LKDVSYESCRSKLLQILFLRHGAKLSIGEMKKVMAQSESNFITKRVKQVHSSTYSSAPCPLYVKFYENLEIRETKHNAQQIAIP
jgi:hypothetical protein